MNHKVSILTSILNGKDFIEGFLKDVERQTIFKECQLIMIDANSDDYLETEEHIHPFVEKHPNASYRKIILNDDCQERDIPGVYKVWNMIVNEYAEAEYLTNWNIDDRRHPEHIELHVEALNRHPAIDLVYGRIQETDKPNETIENNSATTIIDFPDFELAHLFNINMPHNSPVWRAKMHLDYGVFDDSYFSAGDYDMWLRAATRGSQFLKLKDERALGLYYRNPEGISSKESTLEKAIEEVVSIREKHLEWYKRNKLGYVGQGSLW
jgi:hypothetical protein